MTLTLSTGISLSDFKFTKDWTPDEQGPKNREGTPLYLFDPSTRRRYWNKSERSLRLEGCLVATVGLPRLVALSTATAALRVFRLVTCYHFWCCLNRSKVQLVYSLQLPEPEHQSLEVVALPPVEKSPELIDYYKQRRASNEFALTAIPEDFAGSIDESGLIVVGLDDTDVPCAVADPSPVSLQSIHETSNAGIWTLSKKITPRSCGDRVTSARCDAIKLMLTPVNCIAMEFFACYTACCSPNNGRKLFQSVEKVQFDGEQNMPCFSEDKARGEIPELERWRPPETMQMA